MPCKCLEEIEQLKNRIIDLESISGAGAGISEEMVEDIFRDMSTSRLFDENSLNTLNEPVFGQILAFNGNDIFWKDEIQGSGYSPE